MKRKISHILTVVIVILQLCGCGIFEEQTGVLNTEEAQGSGSLSSKEESTDPENRLDASAISRLGEKDNSLDLYSASVNAPLQVEEPAGAIEGGGRRIFLGASRAWHFKKHLFDIERVAECWDELAFVTSEGEKGSAGFESENQLWDVGPVVGTDHYVAFNYEIRESEGDYRYFFVERDENHEALRKFPLDFLSGSDLAEVIMSLSDFAVDHSGMVHLVRQMEEERQYLLVSPEGELLAEYVPENGYIRGLVPLYDGRVAFWAVTERDDENQSQQTTLQYLDAETGKPVLLVAPEQDLYCFTLFDENTLLYADQEGVYRSDLSGNLPDPLYLWMNHGITADEVICIQADGDGQIALVYESSGNYYYLCLGPTREEMEIREITLAVSPGKESVYRSLAATFNKQYPSCHIEIVSSYDQTALLTELIAGKGPVLIDTSLTGFEEQEKLWEPLDTILEQMSISKELLPSVLELGKINGTLYGIVTDFSLRTLVTGDQNLEDWDYDSFLRCIEERTELEAVFNFSGGDYGTYFIMNFISHGMDDTYLLNRETGKMNFDSSEFRKALELAKKYCVREEGVSPDRSSMQEGKVLCNELAIRKPEELALYRVYYGEDANYIGYPTRDGATHFVEGGGNPLAIRRTAAREEKEIACAFISLCLSYEGQLQAAKDINFDLSVRRDVLEEQIASMNENTVVFVPGFEQITLGDNLNVALDRKTLLDMIEKARPWQYFPGALRDILFQELEQYFSGTITEDMAIEHLVSRVGLYLGEGN